jgi:dTDP-4-amino-4,6-dideoxygalactose transaminase
VVVNNPRYRERAEIIWEKGTDRSRFFRGEVAKYTWVELGSSFVLSDVLAALLWAQIQAREQIQQKRREIHHRYAAGLADWAHQSGVMLPRIPSHCDSSFHLFSLLMPTPRGQGGLISHLRSFGIHAVFHYQPLHLTPMGRQLGGRPGQCPVAESVADRLVRLPFFIDLSLGDQERVIDAVRSFHP